MYASPQFSVGDHVMVERRAGRIINGKAVVTKVLPPSTISGALFLKQRMQAISFVLIDFQFTIKKGKIITMSFTQLTIVTVKLSQRKTYNDIQITLQTIRRTRKESDQYLL